MAALDRVLGYFGVCYANSKVEQGSGIPFEHLFFENSLNIDDKSE